MSGPGSAPLMQSSAVICVTDLSLMAERLRTTVVSQGWGDGVCESISELWAVFVCVHIFVPRLLDFVCLHLEMRTCEPAAAACLRGGAAVLLSPSCACLGTVSQ